MKAMIAKQLVVDCETERARIEQVLAHRGETPWWVFVRGRLERPPTDNFMLIVNL